MFFGTPHRTTYNTYNIGWFCIGAGLYRNAKAMLRLLTNDYAVNNSTIIRSITYFFTPHNLVYFFSTLSIFIHLKLITYPNSRKNLYVRILESYE